MLSSSRKFLIYTCNYWSTFKKCNFFFAHNWWRCTAPFIKTKLWPRQERGRGRERDQVCEQPVTNAWFIPFSNNIIQTYLVTTTLDWRSGQHLAAPRLHTNSWVSHQNRLLTSAQLSQTIWKGMSSRHMLTSCLFPVSECDRLISSCRCTCENDGVRSGLARPRPTALPRPAESLVPASHC